MTDNEIIKALECCINEDNDFMACGNKGCAFMECKMGKDRECQYYMMKSVLNLINRQKAEIERLTINMNAFGLGMKREAERADTARAEAIKEVAERLKETIDDYPYVIDRLVKEMVGEGK